jgi:malate dehydrogenase (oxaloacetate-decarboxylating)(NADP+)
VKGALTRTWSRPWRQPDHLRHGQSGSGNHAGGSRRIRDDAIIATGRSDYPNQVNNVLGFPYIFRGALDVRATTINDDMKVAAPTRWPSSRARMCPTRSQPPIRQPAALRSGIHHSGAVRSAPDLGHSARGRQGGNGVRRCPKPIVMTWKPMPISFRRAVTRSPATLQRIFSGSAATEKGRVRRGRGRAGHARGYKSFVSQGLGTAILHRPRRRDPSPWLSAPASTSTARHQLINARLSSRSRSLYARIPLWRYAAAGYLHRDCQRMVNNDRNYFGAIMVARAMPTPWSPALTRNYSVALEDVRATIDPKPAIG